MGERERSLDLARRSAELASNDLTRAVGFLAARVLRMIGGPTHLDELEAQIAKTHEVLQRRGAIGFMPLLLLERAGLARLRGDANGMARDLAEVRGLFAQMGVTGWDDYARSIEA
jgi:hypothetical protein